MKLIRVPYVARPESKNFHLESEFGRQFGSVSECVTLYSNIHSSTALRAIVQNIRLFYTVCSSRHCSSVGWCVHEVKLARVWQRRVCGSRLNTYPRCMSCTLLRFWQGRVHHVCALIEVVAGIFYFLFISGRFDSDWVQYC